MRRIFVACRVCGSATSAELSRLRITQAKRTEERAWLADVSAVVPQQSLRDLDTAYKNSFDSVKGKRAGRRVGPPRYKSKKDTRQSIRLMTNAFSLQDDGTVYVAKVGNLKAKWSHRLPAAPTSLTVTKDSCGRYFLSSVVDTEPDVLPELETDTGIDLGTPTHLHRRNRTARGPGNHPAFYARRS